MNESTTAPAGPVVGFVDDGIGHSSYLVDLGDGTALVVDPRRIPDLERAAAAARGLTIAFTADTHSHADFISGSPELAAEAATFLAPAAGRLEVPHRGLRDGDRVVVGTLVLDAIATPGHTPDHLAYLLRDGGGTPLGLFSGGSLMVGTVGRTDLLGPEHAERLAHEQFHSLHDRILQLPDDLPVYPTHGAGSFCSAPGGDARTTTIGQERASNPLLQLADEAAFVEALLDGFGSFPAYFRRLPEVNRRGPHVYGTAPTLPKLDLATFRGLIDQGAQLVDARPIADFASAHIPGSLSIELRPVFATWLGWLVDASRPVVFVLDERQDRHDLIRQALDVGVEELAGELAGGWPTSDHAGLRPASIGLIPPGALVGAVIDVRQRDEYLAGHVPGARHIELGALSAARDLPAGHLTVMCGHGERAMTGASILERTGRHELSVLRGGPAEWATATDSTLAIGE
jgi:hydroxyacylglutathione hydrolase